jgi:hypothetical protein
MGLTKPQGPGWWQAEDKTWYPPEAHPRWQAPPPRLARTVPDKVAAAENWPDQQYGYVPSRAQAPELPSRRSSIAATNAWQAAISKARRRRRAQLSVGAVVFVLVIAALVGRLLGA